jgi:hypothetical protein
MQETTVREALRAYVSVDEPPLGLTSDGVLAAGRRSRRNRRLAGVAVAGLATALLAAGAVVVLDGARTGPHYEAVAACPYPPGPRPPGQVIADQPLPPMVLEWAKTRLTCHLAQALPSLLPQAQYAQVPGAPAGPLSATATAANPLSATEWTRWP